MPYEKGHQYYPPKDPDRIPGRSREVSRRVRLLAVAVNEAIEPAVMVEYFKRRAMALPGVRFAEDDDGVVHVVWDDVGPAPSASEVDAAVRWLADRGHGQAPQAIHLEASLRAHALGNTVDHKQLGSGAPVLAMLDAFRRSRALPAAVIDAEATEVADDDD